jgi:hypothetical protein
VLAASKPGITKEDELHPLTRSGGIARTRHIDDELGNVRLKGVPPRLPPILRHLLAARNYQIPARS